MDDRPMLQCVQCTPRPSTTMQLYSYFIFPVETTTPTGLRNSLQTLLKSSQPLKFLSRAAMTSWGVMLPDFSRRRQWIMWMKSRRPKKSLNLEEIQNTIHCALSAHHRQCIALFVICDHTICGCSSSSGMVHITSPQSSHQHPQEKLIPNTLVPESACQSIWGRWAGDTHLTNIKHIYVRYKCTLWM